MEDPRPPIVDLAGGPGGSGVDVARNQYATPEPNGEVQKAIADFSEGKNVSGRRVALPPPRVQECGGGEEGAGAPLSFCPFFVYASPRLS